MKAFVNTDIYSGHEVFSEHAVLVDQGQIVGIVSQHEVGSSAELIDLEGRSLAPGFVDLQVNGGGGILFNTAYDRKSVECAVRAHQATGATSIFPTVFTATLNAMRGLLETVIELRHSGFHGIAGIHFEGPAINSDKAGVHDRNNILAIEGELLDLYERAARELPTLITLAPEQVDGSIISRLRRAGALVFAGHTNSTFDTMKEALRCGVQGATHLYNAMSSLGSRDPGVVGAILSNESAYASIILDGHHLHWASFRVAYRAMKSGRLFFVTDAMPCVGSTIKEFELGNLHVFVNDGRCTTADGTLAGSALTIGQESWLRLFGQLPADFKWISAGVF